MRIIENSAKCLRCRNILVSRHPNDFVTCSCGNLSIDGGLDHLSWQEKDGPWSWRPLWVTEPLVVPDPGMDKRRWLYSAGGRFAVDLGKWSDAEVETYRQACIEELNSVGDMLQAWSDGMITDTEISELMHLDAADDLLEIARQNGIDPPKVKTEKSGSD